MRLREGKGPVWGPSGAEAGTGGVEARGWEPSGERELGRPRADPASEALSRYSASGEAPR